MSLGRLLLRRNSLISSSLLDNSCLLGLSSSSSAGSLSLSSSAVCSSLISSGRRRTPSSKCLLLPTTTTGLTVESRRGVKTTDTSHPQPIYNEDEKVLKKVMEERYNNSEDLPIGMDNPYEKPKKKCILCEQNITPNYKNVKLLYQFVSPYTGMKYEQHVTGLCRKKQKQVDAAIDIAVTVGLMSNYLKPVEFLKDPKLCDPERPVKPHKY